MSGHVTFGVLLSPFRCQDMSQFEHMHVIERAEEPLYYLSNFPDVSSYMSFLVP